MTNKQMNLVHTAKTPNLLVLAKSYGRVASTNYTNRKKGC
jgi:hypothetical protein